MRAAVAAGLGYTIGAASLLHGVDFELEGGEVVAVVGPNGAGKTTLLRLLAGELEPTSGWVEIAGRRIETVPLQDLALLRSVLPQHHLLQFAFRCLDVVLMGRYPHSGPESEARAVAVRSMVETDTSQLAARRYTTLSGGEQTRVSFARVLTQETSVVLLDEPTASLDLRHQELVMATLRGLAAAGTAVVAILHDINLAARFADRILILNQGTIHAIGPPAEVLVPEALQAVYGIDVTVVDHPIDDCPLVLPSGGSTVVRRVIGNPTPLEERDRADRPDGTPSNR